MPRSRKPSSTWQVLAWLSALALALLLTASAWALDPGKTFEQYVANRWSIQDGLPQISVLAIAQDRDGYIWAGTQDGVTRFDGVHFTTFTPENEPELAGVWIRALRVDRSGRLWIGSYKGLTRYADGRFRRYRLSGADREREFDVFAIVEDANGTVYCATDLGVLRVAGDGLVRVAPTVQPALSLLLRTDGMWIGTHGAVAHIRNGAMQRLPLPDEVDAAAVNTLVDAQGKIWAGTSQGLYTFDGQTWTKSDDPTLATAPINFAFTDHDHNLWLGTNPALFRIRDGRAVESITQIAHMTAKDMRSIFEDREGNLWLGSQMEGLLRIWNGWTRRYSTPYGLNNPVVWSVARGPGDGVWVGTSDGVSLLDHGRFRTVLEGSRLPHPHAYNLLFERDELWIGTRHGLAILHADGSLETSALFAPMAGAQINGIVRGRDGALWFPTTQGLFRLSGAGQPDAILQRFGAAQGLDEGRVRIVLWLRDGRLLVGTQSGLYEMRGERFLRTDAAAGLPGNIDVTYAYQLPGGEVVIGTQAEQFFIGNHGQWKAIGPDQGMARNSAFFMARDDRGFLWVAGIRGIARVPIADLEAFMSGRIARVRGEMILNERGDRNAGQQGYCCNGAGMAKGFIVDGHILWLPTRDGVVSVDTHGIVKNEVAPVPVIEHVDVGGHRYLPATMPALLAAGERDLSIAFTAPSFQDPHSVQIRYRLRGYDKDWHELDDPRTRSAHYTNLPPRNYVFEVMAANNAGVWAAHTASVDFSIAPYFHETRLFYGLLALLIVAIVYAGYVHQHRQHEVQRAALERMVDERTEQLHVSNSRLENASQTDPATGLRNRRYLANQIPADLAFYDREQQRDGKAEQLMLFALVRLYRADPSGTGEDAQPIGDRTLQQFAQVLSALVRGGDYLVRWADAEVLLLFRPMLSRDIDGMGERILAATRGHAYDTGSGAPVALHCAIGIAEYPLYRDALRRPGWEQVIGLAHAAMRWAIHQGGNRWVAFRPTLRSDLTNIVRELHDDPQPLIDNGRLQVLVAAPRARGDSGAERA